MRRDDREALQRLIEYAKIEAEEQDQAFTAYLLDLAHSSVETDSVDTREFFDLGRARGTSDGLQ
jgi:hypothetical protein